MKKLWVLLSMLFAASAHAAAPPVLYSRETMRIISPSEQKLPWQGEPGFALDVEVRDAATLHSGGWFDLGGLTEKRGVLVLHETPERVSIYQKEVFAPLDIVMFNAQGRIVQMLPAIRLSDLTQPIESAEPVRAVLYLKAGMIEQRKLSLGDSANFRAFKKGPVVLRSEPPSAPIEKSVAAPVSPVRSEPSLDDLLNQQMPEKPKQ